MTDGWWRIKQHAPNAPNGFVVTEIAVVGDPNSESTVASRTFPWWLHDTMLDGPCLSFSWPDGREEYFPWASIVHAEYQPPTQER